MQVPHRTRRPVHPFLGEGQVAPVVRAVREVAVRHGGVARVDEGLEGQEVAFRLAHAAVLENKELAMHPPVREQVASGGECLRNLVGVVHGDVINAARMEVEWHTQVLGCHR